MASDREDKPREKLLLPRVRIQNKAQIAVTPLRAIALEAVEEGVSAVLPERALARSLKDAEGTLLIDGAMVADISRWRKMVFVAVGKCAYRAAAAFGALVRREPDVGVVVGVGKPTVPLPSWARVYAGTHPLPTEANMAGARALTEALEGLTEEDGVVAVVSGGASVLLCGEDTRVCRAEAEITQALFAAGATIYEINIVRKHLSPLRGGGLARMAHPAQVVALVFSDVPGDDMSTIASGPFVRDESTREEAWEVLTRRGVARQLSLTPEILRETPKEDDYFSRVSHFLVASNRHALDAMQESLARHRVDGEVCDRCLTGEARVVGANLARALKEEMSPRSARLYGGETTVTIRGKGKGGRNQEVALGALAAGVPSSGLVVAFASDGCDNGPHAGAVADAVTLARAQEKGLSLSEALAQNDSATFFGAVGDAIITGPTGANVADLLLALRG
ncbi:MAG: D-glycerate 2-kinase [Candidatus Parcubacteria bacterium]|nr:MAG: D-glycerate 2-kinase [Candidatus Parcubacteria bacterium]